MTEQTVTLTKAELYFLLLNSSTGLLAVNADAGVEIITEVGNVLPPTAQEMFPAEAAASKEARLGFAREHSQAGIRKLVMAFKKLA